MRTLDLWDDPPRLFHDDESKARAIVVEALDRPDLAAAALRALRREPRLEEVGALVAVSVAQIARIEPSSGFDDFLLVPYVPAELYARVRLVEWRRSEFATEERVKVGAIVIDRAAHDVSVGGMHVPLTAKEFALLSYVCERRGKVVSRTELLRRVWGSQYEGGARTVDIHVRRLRAKLGAALPLVTLRGAGYRLESPIPGAGGPEGGDASRALQRSGAGEEAQGDERGELRDEDEDEESDDEGDEDEGGEDGEDEESAQAERRAGPSAHDAAPPGRERRITR
ncbi:MULTISPECIES: winged helix-turn-helix domain-containing protein [Sorangium]|uniref:Response regulator transcription factor n=1 Tax=Sorangium atrum TaxID=2995308 RepID=A0ABT5BWK3_9BACT|nr:response regulator transcription factor [Sorangium aterium]MDC0678544.1 response regulator transcription factor [Sorangium aterium]